MNISVAGFRLLGNRSGFTFGRDTQAGLFNEQTVPQWFVGVNAKWYLQRKRTTAGSFYASVVAIGPLVFGRFKYN